MINFTKMHGCGNDYIYVNAMQHEVADPSGFAIRWSDRHKGIGSDGLVLIDKAPAGESADFSMRIFNADGSEAMMCGNASRCIGKYLYERGLTTKTEIRLHTLSGIKVLKLHLTADNLVESVTVDMGTPIFEDDKLFKNANVNVNSTLNSQLLPLNSPSVFVSMGNPHYVIFTDDIDQVGTMGPQLERHPMFPQRCNIEFVTPFPSGEGRGEAFRVRVWERGSGITQACGTGACATAVAAAKTGRAGRTSTIIMDGGTLSIEWSEADNHVYMTGPATFVFDGEIIDN
jgi:diaminopimelate epimerase